MQDRGRKNQHREIKKRRRYERLAATSQLSQWYLFLTHLALHFKNIKDHKGSIYFSALTHTHSPPLNLYNASTFKILKPAQDPQKKLYLLQLLEKESYNQRITYFIFSAH